MRPFGPGTISALAYGQAKIRVVPNTMEKSAEAGISGKLGAEPCPALLMNPR